MLKHAAGLDQHFVSDVTAQNFALGTDTGVAAHARLPSQLDTGFNDGVGANLDVAVDYASLGIKNRDPFVHQLAALGHAHVLVDLGKFGASIAAQNLVGIAGQHRNHPPFAL